MYKNSRTKITTRKDSDDWKRVTGQHSGVCPSEQARTDWFHPQTRENKLLCWPAVGDKNVYINIRISCWRWVIDVQSLQASPVLSRQFVLLGMPDLSLASLGLPGIYSKASNTYYEIVLFRDNFCEGVKIQDPTIWKANTFLEFIAWHQLLCCSSAEKTRGIDGNRAVALPNCTTNC